MNRAVALTTLGRLSRLLGTKIEPVERRRLQRLCAEALEVVIAGEQAAGLREAIRDLRQQFPALRAKQIPPLLDLAALGLRNPPSVRTVQRHMNALRQGACRK